MTTAQMIEEYGKEHKRETSDITDTTDQLFRADNVIGGSFNVFISIFSICLLLFRPRYGSLSFSPDLLHKTNSRQL